MNATPNILVMTKEGCMPCRYVKRVLQDLQREIPGLSVEEVDFGSAEGMRMAIEHQILYPPAVFMDGELLLKGKIREAALKEAVRSRAEALGRKNEAA